MTSPQPGIATGVDSPIPREIYERAEILMDQFRHVEDDRELIARVLMEVAPQTRLGLTQMQQEVLAFVAAYIADRGVSPSYSEITIGLGLSSRGQTHALIHQLVERGAVRIGSRRARSIVVVEAYQ